MLIIERIKRGEVDTKSWIGVTNTTISDYFYAEIFQKIDRDTQVFLLRTSFLSGMDADMARKLTGLDSAEHILSDLNRNHFFADKRPHTNPVYQYHPLFREFLLSRAKDYFSHDDISQIQQKAGTILEDSTGVHVFDFMLLGHGTLSALNAWDFPTADRFLKMMASFLDRARPIDQSFYHSLTAHKALLRGNIAQADSQTKLTWKKGRDTGFPVIDYVYHLERAYVMHGLQEYEETSYHLTQCYKKALMMRSKPFEFMCLIAEAQIAIERGKEEDGLESLKKAMALGRKCGFTNTYIWFPKVMARLCCTALEAGIEVDYVQELIRRRHITPETPPVEIEDWPWPVKIYTLGRFELANDGKAVRFSRKVKKKPLAMLKLLIASGGRHVREDQIIDTLWSESEGDLAHKAFGINLMRLRQIVGEGKAIGYQEGLVTLDSWYCWVDVWAFERILGRAEGIIKEGHRERAIPEIEKAVALYKGGFLADSPELEWATPLRERLRSKFLRCTGELGRIYEETGEFNKAIETLKKFSNRITYPSLICIIFLAIGPLLPIPARAADAWTGPPSSFTVEQDLAHLLQELRQQAESILESTRLGKSVSSSEAPRTWSFFSGDSLSQPTLSGPSA